MFVGSLLLGRIATSVVISMLKEGRSYQTVVPHPGNGSLNNIMHNVLLTYISVTYALLFFLLS